MKILESIKAIMDREGVSENVAKLSCALVAIESIMDDPTLMRKEYDMFFRMTIELRGIISRRGGQNQL